MGMLADIAATIIAQMQKPTLAFLIGGMMLAALGHRVLGGFGLPLARSGPFALRPDNCNQDDRPACKRL